MPTTTVELSLPIQLRPSPSFHLRPAPRLHTKLHRHANNPGYLTHAPPRHHHYLRRPCNNIIHEPGFATVIIVCSD
ncbi:unnamed protein product [Lathyrus oleraceus]